MRIKLTVKPNSGRQELEKISEKEYKAYLKSNPENNKANLELIKIIKKEFKGSEVRIISGKTSRKKMVEIK